MKLNEIKFQFVPPRRFGPEKGLLQAVAQKTSKTNLCVFV